MDPDVAARHRFTARYGAPAYASVAEAAVSSPDLVVVATPMAGLREVLAGFPGIAYSFSQPIEMRVSEMLVGVRGDVAIKIFGTDLAALNDLAMHTAEAVRKVKGAEDVFTLKNEGVQYYRVAIDRLAAGRLGLSVDAIEEALRLQEAHGGEVVVLSMGPAQATDTRSKVAVANGSVSASQIALRAERLKLATADLLLLTELLT